MQRTLFYFILLAACCLFTEGCSRPVAEQARVPPTPEIPAQTASLSPAQTPVAASRSLPERSRPPARLQAFASSRAAATRGGISVLSSEPDSAFADFVADLNRVLSRDEIHLLPITGRGTVHTLRDLQRIRSIDIGVVQTDALAALDKRDPARRRLRYIARLYNKEFHVLASRDVTDLRQLDGRKVNIDQPGTGTHLMARNVFEKLRIAPEFTTDDQPTSYRRLRSGEIAAAVYVAPRPAPEIAQFEAEDRFHLVTVPYDDEVADGYLPAQFDMSDYPNLAEGGKPIETIAVGTVLAVLNRSQRTDSYKQMARFIDAYFSRFNEIREVGRHAKWDEASPSVTVPGWQRLRPAQEWLERKALKPDR
jgi:TRAP-type uncharacterized transport system substrate-binding protein